MKSENVSVNGVATSPPMVRRHAAESKTGPFLTLLIRKPAVGDLDSVVLVDPSEGPPLTVVVTGDDPLVTSRGNTSLPIRESYDPGHEQPEERAPSYVLLIRVLLVTAHGFYYRSIRFF